MEEIRFTDIVALQRYISPTFTEVGTITMTTADVIQAAKLIGDSRIALPSGEVLRQPKEGYTMLLVFRLEMLGQPWEALGFRVVGDNPRATKNRGVDRLRFLKKVPLEVPLRYLSRLSDVVSEQNGGTTLWNQTEVWGPGDRDRPIVTYKFGTTYRT